MSNETPNIRFRCDACGRRYRHLQESLTCPCRSGTPSPLERMFNCWIEEHWRDHTGNFNAAPTLLEAFAGGAKHAALRMKSALDVHQARLRSKHG